MGPTMARKGLTMRTKHESGIEERDSPVNGDTILSVEGKDVVECWEREGFLRRAAKVGPGR